jgi:hypothetical protein
MKQLKKMTRIFLLLTLGILFSCSSNDDNTETPLNNSELIIGSWKWTSTTETIDGADTGASLTECDLLEITNYDGTKQEITEYSGNPCTLLQLNTPTYNYSIDGDIISFPRINDEYDFYSQEIIELNSTTLKLKLEETDGGETFICIDTYTKIN